MKNKAEEYKIDAADQSLGRVASQIAILLCGKNKADYVAHQNKGGKVIVENVARIKFTGKKLVNKMYYHHTGYPGHLKSVTLGNKFKKSPGLVLRDCVFGMLPKNKLRTERIKRLILK